MEKLEFEKSKALIIVEIIEYVPDSVVIKTIIKKSTGNINAVSFDTGEKLEEKISPFDKFIQIIDGKPDSRSLSRPTPPIHSKRTTGLK